MLIQMVKTIALKDQNEVLCLFSSNSDWDMTECMDILTFGKMRFLTFFIKNVNMFNHLKIMKADQQRAYTHAAFKNQHTSLISHNMKTRDIM